MYLKSLTLKGFKSFADRAHMTFEPGLTVIVGPNGSGKSNVSDAILWVLGEQSAKQLRGQAMEDVIFSGSSARKPVGVAEVTLVLDNSDHVLPVDFNEVAITRRMYRSGESEYLINSSPCRLMDIQDILHDSGMGKDTHSIISQGKLDAILQSRPEERRSLIEEAAGISKHKRRKERALRKVASMDEHLTRARDINREITRQLRPLERQVDRARKHRELTARANELTQILAVDELRRLQASWSDLEIRGKEAEAASELARYRLSEKERELEKLQVMLEEKGLFVGDLGEQRRHMQDVVGRIGSDMRLLEEKGRNMVARRSSQAAETDRDAQPQLEELASARDAASAEVERISRRVDEVSDELERVRVQDAEAAGKLSDAKVRLAQATERTRSLSARAPELERRLEGLDRRIRATSQAARSLEVLRLRVDPLHDRYQALSERAMDWAARLRDQASIEEADSASLKRTIEDARGQVESARQDVERAAAAVNEAKVERGKLEVQVENAVSAITADGTTVLEEALALPAPSDRTACERELSELVRKINNLGPVNQVAFEEYERLRERADYISAQLADLEGARAALTKITAAIDRKMRASFISTFQKVDANFREVFEMLFPGGSAHLEMTDPDHPADTGIEVVAQPRGKRITKMMLMSGGEKSLTALALLFAVYRTRTVPFYVLDEVEAALDDSNLSKLIGAIDVLRRSTQLLVISHQRRTMEDADVLYGVSMQADGVSRVVSQRLDRETGKVVNA